MYFQPGLLAMTRSLPTTVTFFVSLGRCISWCVWSSAFLKPCAVTQAWRKCTFVHRPGTVEDRVLVFQLLVCLSGRRCLCNSMTRVFWELLCSVKNSRYFTAWWYIFFASNDCWRRVEVLAPTSRDCCKCYLPKRKNGKELSSHIVYSESRQIF